MKPEGDLERPLVLWPILTSTFILTIDEKSGALAAEMHHY